jgi:hypothetical protein
MIKPKSDNNQATFSSTFEEQFFLVFTNLLACPSLFQPVPTRRKDSGGDIAL